MTKIKLTWLCLCLDISYSFSAIFFFKYIESFYFAKLVLLSSIMQNKKKKWVNRIIITIYCSTFDMWNRSWLLRYFHSICICWKKYFFFPFHLKIWVNLTCCQGLFTLKPKCKVYWAYEKATWMPNFKNVEMNHKMSLSVVFQTNPKCLAGNKPTNLNDLVFT